MAVAPALHSRLAETQYGGGKPVLLSGQFKIKPAKWRARIAADKTSAVDMIFRINARLFQKQSHKCLGPGHIGGTVGLAVTIVKRYRICHFLHLWFEVPALS